MCGIWTFINFTNGTFNMAQLFSDFWNIKHRGPDNSYFEVYNNVCVGFHRLAIMDTSFKSNQPYVFQEKTKTVVFMCNGEIYNYRELIEKYHLPITNNSDCMTIPALYIKFSKEEKIQEFYKLFEKDIKGEFAFVLLEFDLLKNLKKIIIGRDQIGIRPLYYSPYKLENNYMIITSEIKGANKYDGNLEEFPPGNIYTYDSDGLGNFKMKPTIFKNIYSLLPIEHANDAYYLSNIKMTVINCIKRRLSSDRPIAFLLSGGVDSSLVASIASRLLATRINTFCCGMSEGTDLIYARKVAKHINSNHTEVMFTPEDGLNAIRDVIWTIETWDTTTIRASIGQYLVSKYIGLNTDTKVLLVGEGPDEVCSSYLFNWYAPDGNKIEQSAKEYVEKIHLYDGRRADRCISRWGLEARVPLLDPEFIKAYWEIPGIDRMPKTKGIEKWWLRKAFEDTNILPSEVLWRKKEAFSDGVSSKEKSWFQIIQDYIETLVTDDEMASQMICKTKEAYYYRKIFCEMFGDNRVNIIPGYWQPKWNKDGEEIKEYIDPSARVLDIYKK
jgi:asparagine synthase (glutamine-hydrolysing)